MLAPRTTIAMRYKVLSLLGQGGMGHVYRAEHLLLRKHVALKVIDRDRVGDLGARFEREALALARLDHPNCVRVLDYGRTTDGVQYIAMDLLEGPTLASTLHSPASVARTLFVGRGLLAALAHAHRLGILHRDVKPENVMFSHSGRPVLIDFGLARMLDDERQTAVGVCVGSPSYLAPERLLGRLYDARADLYAVGVVLYEMLAGTKPFVGETPHEILAQHVTRPPRPLRAIRADVPAALEAVVARALAKEAARRYVDAEHMLSALAEVPDSVAGIEPTARIERPDEPTTIALGSRPSLPSRVWSWLRFGGWRWDEDQPSAGR